LIRSYRIVRHHLAPLKKLSCSWRICSVPKKPMPAVVSVAPEVRDPSGTGVVLLPGKARPEPLPDARQPVLRRRRPFHRTPAPRPGGPHQPVRQQGVRLAREVLPLEGPPAGRPPEVLLWASESRVRPPRNHWPPISPSRQASAGPRTRRPTPAATETIRCIIEVPRIGRRTVITMQEETDIMVGGAGRRPVMPSCRTPVSVCGTR